VSAGHHFFHSLLSPRKEPRELVCASSCISDAALFDISCPGLSMRRVDQRPRRSGCCCCWSGAERQLDGEVSPLPTPIRRPRPGLSERRLELIFPERQRLGALSDRRRWREGHEGARRQRCGELLMELRKQKVRLLAVFLLLTPPFSTPLLSPTEHSPPAPPAPPPSPPPLPPPPSPPRSKERKSPRSSSSSTSPSPSAPSRSSATPRSPSGGARPSASSAAAARASRRRSG